MPRKITHRIKGYKGQVTIKWDKWDSLKRFGRPGYYGRIGMSRNGYMFTQIKKGKSGKAKFVKGRI